jgi:G3E family GTPase
MTMQRPIDLYMISGFFGSGKTTLLQNILEALGGRRAGLIINEAGQVSIDTGRLAREKAELTEITNGSIYCACMRGDFIRALLDFAAEGRNTDVLFIENSGMSDPANIHRILSETAKLVQRPYRYCGCICVVDAVSFLKHVKVLTAVENQVRAADCVLVNKKDLADDAHRRMIHETVAAINPSARIIDTVRASVPVSAILDGLSDNGFDAETTNRCTERPVSCVLEWSRPVEEKSILAFLQTASKEAYRIKGSVQTENGWKQADAVEERIDLMPETDGDHPEYSRLVIVLRGHESKKEEFEKAFHETCGVPAAVFG